jgi:hypothetical protein
MPGRVLDWKDNARRSFIRTGESPVTRSRDCSQRAAGADLRQPEVYSAKLLNKMIVSVVLMSQGLPRRLIRDEMSPLFPVSCSTYSQFLRYTDLASAIQLARTEGLTTVQIVRVLSANISHAEALTLARRAAPLLEIKVSTFMRLRRNE